ncbi:hypothetical protein Bca4012_071896 [Brassica carinata]|uniref:Uncharacterized protein n=1 Tax=Brassica carinata TaxID=52824 RepID=A0A8X7UA09_BRACI|nr:hypothetical protein Bca52824_064316 [Brassica carinata]
MANRRVSSRTRKVATKMAAALTSTDNRTQAAIARLEALENDNGALKVVDLNDDEEASLDEEDDLGELLLNKHLLSNIDTRSRNNKKQQANVYRHRRRLE